MLVIAYEENKPNKTKRIKVEIKTLRQHRTYLFIAS